MMLGTCLTSKRTWPCIGFVEILIWQILCVSLWGLKHDFIYSYVDICKTTLCMHVSNWNNMSVSSWWIFGIVNLCWIICILNCFLCYGVDQKWGSYAKNFIWHYENKILNGICSCWFIIQNVFLYYTLI